MNTGLTLRQQLDRFRRWALEHFDQIKADESLDRAEYLQRVSELHAKICQRGDLPWASAHFEPLVTDGRAAYYYGVVKDGGEECFLKVRPVNARTHATLDAFARNQLPAQGKYYQCLTPRKAVYLPNVAGIYLFPLWRHQPKSIQGAYANPLFQRGLAEFNLSLAGDIARWLLRLGKLPLALQPLEAADFERYSTPSELIERYVHNHDRIRALWGRWQRELDALPQGFLHADLGVLNFKTHEDRLLLLDLEDACIGPLGGDLAWMLFYAERIKNAQERRTHIDRILDGYVSSCVALGQPITKEQASLAAYALYFMKWLIPGPGTQSNMEALAQRQEAALKFFA